MQKKLLKPLLIHWKKVKRDTERKILRFKYRAILNVFQLLADLITNASIIVIVLLVIFLGSITLSFSLSVFFDSHVKGFLAATLLLTLAALIVLWKRPSVENYFAGLAIARYFEKLHQSQKTDHNNGEENVVKLHAKYNNRQTGTSQKST